ncbi:MAG: GNAT family N-acetyltransferase [Candidatus Hodarchaeales archaeon]|jgi:GNAT superfamily N-acetyltransferase
MNSLDKIKTEHLDKNNFLPAILVFCKAMEFTEEDTKNRIINDAKMLIENEMFEGIVLKDKTTGEIIGLGTFLTLKKSGWIPHVGVEPSYQGKGLGKRIMIELLKLGAKKNFRSIELSASENGLPMYKKLGFREDYNASKVKLNSVRREKVIDLDILDSIPEWIFDYDKMNLGINRKKLLLANRHPKFNIIHKENEGYGIIYGEHLGPVVANSPEIASNIYYNAFQKGIKNTIIIESNIDLYSFLDYEREATATIMTYGEILRQKIENIYAMRGFALS